MIFPSKNHLLRSSHRAFTLIELLVVIGLIAALAGGIGLALGGGDKANALQGGQATLQSLVSSVRGQAVLSGVDQAGLFVDVTADGNFDQNRFLRSFVIAVNGSGGWTEIGDETSLPSGIYLLPPSDEFRGKTNDFLTAYGYAKSGAFVNSPSEQTFDSFPEKKYALVLKLSPQGRLDSSSGYLALSPAEVDASGGVNGLKLKFDRPQLVRGVLISNYGVLTPINDVDGFQNNP